MKVEIVSSEDRNMIVACFPFFGIIDHIPGMRARETVTELLTSEIISSQKSLTEILEEVNRKIKNPAYSPGAIFALAKITNYWVEIAQCGDCFALWEKENGEIDMTANQIFYVIEMMFFKKNISPKLKEVIKKKANKGGYGLLNGDPSAKSFIARFLLKRKGLKTLILFNSGVVENYAETDPSKRKEFAKKFIKEFRQIKPERGSIIAITF